MTETPKDENEGTGGPSELSAGLGCDLRALLIACRSSVKFDLLRYEKMARAYGSIGAEGEQIHAVAESEATRLSSLLEKIDALAPTPPND